MKSHLTAYQTSLCIQSYIEQMTNKTNRSLNIDMINERKMLLNKLIFMFLIVFIKIYSVSRCWLALLS